MVEQAWLVLENYRQTFEEIYRDFLILYHATIYLCDGGMVICLIGLSIFSFWGMRYT